MDRHRYDAVTTQVRTLAGLAIMFDPEELTEAIRAIDHADTAGAVLDPTAWIGGHERLDALRDLVDAVRNLRHAAVRFQEVVAETEPQAARARREVGRG